MKFRFLILFLLLFCIPSMYSQTLEGYIYDKLSEKPLSGATVYIDGTTISSSTNEDGYFKINGSGNKNSVLVVSFVGYITSRIENPFQYKKIKTFLDEDRITMAEVVIGKSIFTRKSMLKAFRENFLGISEAGLSCKIENEDDINLFFDEETKMLSATSRTPLKVINKNLGYEVFFDLVDFSVEYNEAKLSPFYVRKSSFAGTSFYKDISKSKKADKKRQESFLGSATHLMMTIANESWQKEKFGLYVDRFAVDPKEYFKVKDTLGVKIVKVLKEPVKKTPIYKKYIGEADLNNRIHPEIIGYKDEKANFNILYDGKKQSVAEFLEKEFIVDENGNYSPVYLAFFGGYLGTQKLGNMLPSDYYQSIKGKY